MTRTVTLELPSELVERADVVASRTRRPVEAVLVEWMSRAGTDSVADLSDEEVLALCDSRLPDAEQDQLTLLLDRQREGVLSEADRPLLEDLLRQYRRGLVRKAMAWQTAVSRGLRPPLGEP